MGKKKASGDKKGKKKLVLGTADGKKRWKGGLATVARKAGKVNAEVAALSQRLATAEEERDNKKIEVADLKQARPSLSVALPTSACSLPAPLAGPDAMNTGPQRSKPSQAPRCRCRGKRRFELQAQRTTRPQRTTVGALGGFIVAID